MSSIHLPGGAAFAQQPSTSTAMMFAIGESKLAAALLALIAVVIRNIARSGSLHRILRLPFVPFTRFQLIDSVIGRFDQSLPFRPQFTFFKRNENRTLSRIQQQTVFALIIVFDYTFKQHIKMKRVVILQLITPRILIIMPIEYAVIE